jgi:ABC-type glycerol-3-phosphate transport system substrate-binding protein
VLWHSWAQADGDALAAILANLKTQFPGVTVETLFVAPDDLLTAYADAVRAGSGPDLVLAPNWWLADLAQSQALLPLDALAPAAALNSFWPAALDSLRWQGQLLGLPVDYQLVALYVNQPLLAGQPPAATLDELMAQARANPAQGAGLYASLFHLAWGFPAFGAQILGPDGRALLDQSGGAADFLTWLAALNEIQGSYVDQDYGMLLDRYQKGEFAYLVDGPWAAAGLRAALGDGLVVMPLPAGPAGPARPWLYTDGLFLNPNLDAARQDLALTVALAFTAPENGAVLAEVAGLLPANRRVDLSGDPLLAGFAAQAATAGAMPAAAEMAQVWGYGGDMILKALAGVAAPPAIIAETTALINEANGK